MSVHFDVRSYVRDPRDVRPADLDLSGGATPQALRALAHVWSVEREVLDHMRDLLVTPTHSEARVTAFLTTWAYEQYWLSQSLAALLEADGVTPEELPATPTGRVRRVWDERVVPTVGAIRTNLLGHDLVAAHMVTGWLSTAVATLSLSRLAEIEPVLTQVRDALMPVKQRHLDFYADEARRRLDGEPGAQRLARRAVSRWRWPGVRYRGRAGVRPAVVTLFSDGVVADRVRAIDATVAAWPGLNGARPVARALAQLA